LLENYVIDDCRKRIFRSSICSFLDTSLHVSPPFATFFPFILIKPLPIVGDNENQLL